MPPISKLPPRKWMLAPHPEGLIKYPISRTRHPITKEDARKLTPHMKRWILQVTDRMLQSRKYQEQMPTKRLQKATGFSRSTLLNLANTRKVVLGIDTKGKRGGPRIRYPAAIIRIIEEMHMKAKRKGGPVSMKELILEIARKTGYWVTPVGLMGNITKLNTKSPGKGNGPVIDYTGLGMNKQAVRRILKAEGIKAEPWKRFRKIEQHRLEH